jgi:hypothetical protein
MVQSQRRASRRSSFVAMAWLRSMCRPSMSAMPRWWAAVSSDSSWAIAVSGPRALDLPPT